MTSESLRALKKYWKPGTSKVLALVTLLTLLLFGALFYLYVSQNYSYLVERNFRLLATWGTELTETFDNYEQSFRFRVQEESATLARPSSLIRPRGIRQALRNEGLVLEGFAPIKEADYESQNKPRYKMMLEQQTREQLSLLPFSYVQNAEPSSPPPGQTSPEPKDAPPTITFSYSPNQPGGMVQAKAQEHDGTVTATASIMIGDLLQQMSTESIFEDVLLADPSGAIIFQRNPSTLQFVHLRNLFHHQRIDNGLLTDVFKEGGLQQAKILDPKNLSHVMKTATPSHFQVTVGGNTYEIFMQAVVFPSITIPEGQHQDIPWIICGILPSSTFQEQYLAIPFTVLLFCLFLFISAILALPFFSLVMMNPGERLTRFSVVSLLITNILGAGIGTLFLLDLGFYRQSVADFHDRLTATTDSVAEAFHTQLDRMVWQLDRYNQQFHELQDRDRFPTEPGSKAWLARVKLPDPCKDSQEKALPLCYPNFSLAFWVDERGILRETWTQAATPYVRGTHDLSQRDYITKVQANSKHLHRRLIDNRWLEFYVQPLISFESSTRSLVVSLPYQISSDNQTHATPWVAAIQSEDFSLLKEAVLPPGTGYAVIEDQTGVAVLHSNGRRMLRENFLEETDNNPEIAALIHARTEGAVEGDYWGSGHRFAIKPLSGLPWTLVVFESKEAFRTTNFEVLLFSLSLFTLYILVLLLWIKSLTLVYRSNVFGQRIRWTWPKQGLRGAYQGLSLLQILIFVLGLAAVFGMDWQEEMMEVSFPLTFALLPFLTIWVVVRTLWKGQFNPSVEKSEQASDPWTLLQTSQLIGTFTRFGVTSFLLLGVFPAILFFKVAHDQEMRLFAQHHLWGLAQSLAQQTQGPWMAKGTGESSRDFQMLTSPTSCLIGGCQISEESTPIMKSAACSPWTSASATVDLQYSLQNVFTEFPLATCLAFDSKSWNPKEAIRPSWLDRFHQLIRKSSLHNPMNKESWGFLHPPSPDATTTWTQNITDGYRRVMLRINDFPQGGDGTSAFGPLHLSLWMPLFPWNLSVRLLPIVFMAGLLIVIGYPILRYMVKKIYAFPSFFHRSHEIGAASIPQPPLSLEHLLVVGPPGSGKSQLARTLSPDCPVLDIHETYGKVPWAESMVASLPEQTTAVILDHFEYRWEDLVHRKEKGVLVERLLTRGLKVCIFSTRDLLEWTKTQVSDHLENEQDPMLPYWIDLLGSFGFIHFTPSRMETLLQEWLHPQTESPGGTGPILPVKQCLYQEALPTLHLERIGKWIRSDQEWATWTPGQMKEQFLRIGWPYYQAIWRSCSFSEQLTLYHIAVDGYLHSGNPDLTSLSQKGLIRLTPELQLMNESFRQCILQLGLNFQLSEWEKQTNQNTWGKLKWPFLLIFGTILLFFFFTQQEFKNSFITLISLLPILLPALPDLPVLLTGPKNIQSSSG